MGNNPGFYERADSKHAKGKVGEMIVGKELEKICDDETVRFFNNVMLTRAFDGAPSQVDFVLLTVRGFFAIEVKNWTGTVDCSKPNDETWDVIYGHQIISQRSPLIQVTRNAQALENLTGSPYTGVIIFTEAAKLLGNQNPNLIKISELDTYLKEHERIYTIDRVKEESKYIWKWMERSERV